MKPLRSRLSLPFLLLALLVLAPPALQPAAEADGDGDEAAMSTLLVKLPAEHVKDLVAWTHANGGRVVDTETMTRLVPLGVPEPASTPVVQRKTLPTLASARAMLDAANAVIAEVRGKEPAHTLLLQQVTISGSRMRLKLVLDRPEGVDRVRAALGTHTSIAKRARGGVEVGTLQRRKDGRVQADLSLRFASPYVGARPIAPAASAAGTTDPFDVGPVEQAALSANMTQTYASSVRRDRNAREGIELRYRDYQFEASDVERLNALLHNLERGSLTVTELHYSLADPKQQEAGKPLRINKPKLRMAVVAVSRR